MFQDFNRENQCFFLSNVQISSRVRSYIICGLINLQFGGRVRDSLVLNLNGEDRIWSPRSFSLRTVLMFPDFKRENRCFFSSLSKFIKGSILLHLWPD